MKNLLVILTIALSGTQVLAQTVDVDGNIQLRNGRSTVQITIGDQRSSGQQLNRRVRRLEQAVRDLQETVYDLQLNQTPIHTDIEFTCRLETSFNVYSAKGVGSNLRIAENNARQAVINKCLSREHFVSNCPESSIKKCFQSR